MSGMFSTTLNTCYAPVFKVDLYLIFGPGSESEMYRLSQSVGRFFKLLLFMYKILKPFCVG